MELGLRRANARKNVKRDLGGPAKRFVVLLMSPGATAKPDRSWHLMLTNALANARELSLRPRSAHMISCCDKGIGRSAPTVSCSYGVSCY